MAQSWITRYHEYFSPIQQEMHSLPEQYHQDPGAIGFATIPDHPSSVIQRLASFFMHPPMEGATYYLYLRICEIIEREPNEEAVRFHP
jgi:hypothetical protein